MIYKITVFCSSDYDNIK